MTTDDMELLREYARRHSEEAFAALVARHVNLVYSVALRQVRDPHLAEEVTQAVFVILARKAGSLDANTILSGWLCRTARYVSGNALTIERRRQRREQEAYMQSLPHETESDVWNQISPLLDAALARLGKKDHDAIVLRYFENKDLSQIGAAIGSNESAASKRLNRALEKLRKFFSKHGVVWTTTVIAGAISANSVQAAPAALAKSATVAAITKGAAASASTATLIQGALKLMVWSEAKTALTLGLVTIFVAGTTTGFFVEIHRGRSSDALKFYNSAMKHYFAQEYDAELADLNKAIKIDPHCANGDALFSRACLYGGNLPMAKRDYKKAFSDYTQLLTIKPTDVSAWHNRALCCESLRKYDNAISDYTAIIEGNMDYSHLSDGKDKQLAADYHYRGRAFQWYKKDYAKAIADYTEALRLDPNIDMTHKHLGECYQALGEPDKAKEEFALEKTP